MRSPSRSLTIGQVARSCGVTVEAVRFYEREGLLPKPRRRPSGYRVYAGDIARCLRFSQSAKTAELDAKLHELNRMRAALVRLSAACTARGPSEASRLLDALEIEEPHAAG